MALRLVSSHVAETTTNYNAGLTEKDLIIHCRALIRAQAFRACDADLIESLREVEDDKIHLKLELTSVYQYAIQIMKLSKDIARGLIAIMRKSRTVPELAAKIRDGSISASKARKVISVINDDNKAAWLELASTKTSREIEKAVAGVNPQAAVSEKIRYKSAQRLEFTIGVSEEWLDLLNDIKDLLSQKQQKSVGSEDALFTVMREFNDRHHPVARAERVARRRSAQPHSEQSSQPPSQSDENENLSVPGRITERRRLNASEKNAVLLRDRHQCQHASHDGVSCMQKRRVDVHHVVPVCRGGGNNIENLITLCSAHHRLHHHAERR